MKWSLNETRLKVIYKNNNDNYKIHQRHKESPSKSKIKIDSVRVTKDIEIVSVSMKITNNGEKNVETNVKIETGEKEGDRDKNWVKLIVRNMCIEIMC